MSWLLVAGIAPLLLGPVLVRLMRSVSWAPAALDAFVTVGIGGIAVLHILPQSIEMSGWLAVVAAFVGLVAPIWLERLLHNVKPGRESRALLLFAAFALALHAALDGVALAGGEHDHAGHDHGGQLLAFAVILHRLPVGVGLWWFLRTSMGVRVAVGAVAMMVVATVFGSLGGDVLMHGSMSQVLGAFQALVAGSLLHVVAGHHSFGHNHSDSQPRWQIASGLSGLIAAGLLAFIEQLHEPHGHVVGTSAGSAFMALALATAPAMVTAYLVTGVASAVVPAIAAYHLTGKSFLSQAVRGVVLGFPTAICSCGVLSKTERHVVQHAPAAASAAFLVSSSSLGLAGLLLSFALLGPKVALARVAGAMAMSLLAGLWAGKLAAMRRVDVSRCDCDEPTAEPGNVRVTLRQGLRFAFGETLDHTAPWIVAGLGIAAFMEPNIRAEWMTVVPAWLEVPLAAALGLPAYVCAAGATPIAAVLMHKGVSAGAVVAFLLAGPALMFPLFGIPQSRKGRAGALALTAAMVVLATLVGYAVNALAPELDTSVFDGQASWIEMASLMIAALALVISLMRQGVRGFIKRIVYNEVIRRGG